MPNCGDCGGHISWDEDVCSAICISCGTLQDPTQSVLVAHLEESQHNNSSRETNNPLWKGSTTLKSVRRNGWDLSGQGKEVRDKKNTYAMYDFIRSIALRLSNPGISPRAAIIFNQAMSLGHYRWGRRARLTAGASIAIGLRESHKSDSILDIAYLIDESPASLSRAFKKVMALLQLEMPSSDATVHLPSLQSHLHSLLHPVTPPSPLPSALLKQISKLPLHLVICTATSICALLGRLTLKSDRASTPPIACAALILALEAEVRTSLTSLTEFARLLASRFGLAEGTVLRRYNDIYNLIEEWIREVPWLEQIEMTGNGRKKVPKRVIIARGIKDVVQFQEEIWRKKVEAQGKIQVELDEEDGSETEILSTTAGSSCSTTKRGSEGPTDTVLVPVRKRRRTGNRDLDEASKFLLCPLSSPLPTVVDPIEYSSATSQRTDSTPIAASRPSTPPPMPLMSYILTASPSTLSLNLRPSRFQLLVAQRPRGADDIEDHELFVEGELEGLLRSDAEVKTLRVAMDWPDEDIASSSLDKVRNIGTRGIISLNTAQLDSPSESGLHPDETPQVDDNADLEIEAWRPLSPSGRSFDGFDRYDEEY